MISGTTSLARRVPRGALPGIDGCGDEAGMSVYVGLGLAGGGRRSDSFDGSDRGVGEEEVRIE